MDKAQIRALKAIAKLAVIPALKRLAPQANPLDQNGYKALHFERKSRERVMLLEAWYRLAGGVEVEGIDNVLHMLFDCGVQVRLPDVEQQWEQSQLAGFVGYRDKSGAQ